MEPKTGHCCSKFLDPRLVQQPWMGEGLSERQAAESIKWLQGQEVGKWRCNLKDI